MDQGRGSSFIMGYGGHEGRHVDNKKLFEAEMYADGVGYEHDQRFNDETKSTSSPLSLRSVH